jgi:hypothetical protein
MARKDYTSKRAIGMLREAEVRLIPGREDQQDLSRPWDYGKGVTRSAEDDHQHASLIPLASPRLGLLTGTLNAWRSSWQILG